MRTGESARCGRQPERQWQHRLRCSRAARPPALAARASRRQIGTVTEGGERHGILRELGGREKCVVCVIKGYLDLQNLLAEEALPRALSLPLLEELTEASVQSVWAGDMGRRKTPRVRLSGCLEVAEGTMALVKSLFDGERDVKNWAARKESARRRQASRTLFSRWQRQAARCRELQRSSARMTNSKRSPS